MRTDGNFKEGINDFVIGFFGTLKSNDSFTIKHEKIDCENSSTGQKFKMEQPCRIYWARKIFCSQLNLYQYIRGTRYSIPTVGRFRFIGVPCVPLFLQKSLFNVLPFWQFGPLLVLSPQNIRIEFLAV